MTTTSTEKEIIQTLEKQVDDIFNTCSRAETTRDVKACIIEIQAMSKSLPAISTIITIDNDRFGGLHKRCETLLEWMESLKISKCCKCKRSTGSMMQCGHSICMRCINESVVVSNHINADKVEYCIEYAKKCPKCRAIYSVEIRNKKKACDNNNITKRGCSVAWEYFDKNGDGTRICKLCQREYSNNTSTHTLMNHMHNTHPEIKVEKAS